MNDSDIQLLINELNNESMIILVENQIKNLEN
jgi:hypothetical protein